MKSNILIVPGNTDLNRGDQALVWESIRLMKDVIPYVEVSLYNAGVDIWEQKAQKAQTAVLGYSFFERILQHPRVLTRKNVEGIRYSKLTLITWALKASIDLVVTTLLFVKSPLLNKIGGFFLNKNQKQTVQLFSQLKFLVVKGGGFLHSYGKFHDPYTMYFFLFDILLAKRYDVKVLVLPNSIGPLKNNIARSLVKKTLSKCDFISTRESVSSNYLKKSLSINNYLFPDLGFFLEPSDIDFIEELKNLGVDFSRKRVAVTLRPYRFDGKVDAEKLYEKYLNEITRVIINLVAENFQISLIAHTLGPSAHENDQLAINEVLKRIDKNKNVIYLTNSNWDCQQLQKIYSYYDLLIGTRFHSVIFALNMFVPCIAIAYGGNKSFGIMEDIGISDYVIGIDRITENEVMKMISSILSNRDNYIEKISDYKKILAKQRERLISEIKSAL